MNNPLVARFDGKPFLVAAEMQAVFESCLHQAASTLARIEGAVEKPKMVDDFWFNDDHWMAEYRPYKVSDGILQIPVKGVLFHDFPYQLGSWATGYEYIWRAFQRGMADVNVKGIAIVCDTPGGEVAGNFDLVDRIFATKGTKPIHGFAMESAYSAGYSIISACDDITVARTGGVGSIGVITSHVDMSAALAQRGLKITFIHFGKYKAEGNAYEALSPEARARIQERIDEVGQVFVATVARNRGMSEQAVRDTEALTFTASQAVSNGLADHIGSFDDAIAAFAADLSRKKENTMSEKEKAAIDTAAVDNARAEGLAEGHAAVVKEGATAERARISAIIESEEGQARPAAAMAAAMDTDMTAEQATKFLAKLPAEAAPAAPSASQDEPKGANGAAKDFATAMNHAKHPEAGAPSDETAESDPSRARAARALASIGQSYGNN
ncbi:S49 family peptidase [Paracoccus sp. (in: a-proteobacteria)]|uniref:S49 family peptidase n=1 Tax=Paracoccus sp. TaxID=267 RepID=UPI0026DF0AE9|nr:S49 family peptidase [Paracoccus sp. (in: a-proteobacteria)]MDO5646310.1 S49 family peptidase [Paracoccus sp. (in: a-proteobacteria)]